MLSKTKSRQINLLKYTILFPVVFGMLIYTSSYAQEVKKTETTQEDPSTQGLSDQALFQKYYDDVEEKMSNDEEQDNIFNEYMPNQDKYILSREELFKSYAFLKFLNDKLVSKKRKDGTFTVKDEEREKRLSYPNYQEYLDSKKTLAKKLDWENVVLMGSLRLVVDDFKNMTENEKARYDKKMDMLLKDDYFHKLIIFDMHREITTELTAGSKPINIKPEDDTKAFEESIEVPFAVIENVPIYPGCESLPTNNERKQCMADKITQLVNTNFNTKLGKEFGLQGRQRISVIFKIDPEGNIVDIKSRAPHPSLEEEAVRVIKLLPKMIPGKQKGHKVTVPYSLPIVFVVADNDTNQDKDKN